MQCKARCRKESPTLDARGYNERLCTQRQAEAWYRGCVMPVASLVYMHWCCTICGCSSWSLVTWAVLAVIFLFWYKTQECRESGWKVHEAALVVVYPKCFVASLTYQSYASYGLKLCWYKALHAERVNMSTTSSKALCQKSSGSLRSITSVCQGFNEVTLPNLATLSSLTSAWCDK